MALTDYKIKRIIKRASGKTEVVMAIYEGDITTEQERDIDGKLVNVTRYRRTTLLRTVKKMILNSPTEMEIRDNCDVELNTDITRTSIAGQKRAVLRV